MKLSKQEAAHRNIQLTKELLLYLLQHPEEIEGLNGKIIIDMPLNDPELFEENLKIAAQILRDSRWHENGKREILLRPV